MAFSLLNKRKNIKKFRANVVKVAQAVPEVDQVKAVEVEGAA